MYGGTTYDCFAVSAVFWWDDEHAASEPADLLGILSFLKLSWHGAKNSCLSASSDESLHLGLTAKHLSTRLKKELGIVSSKSGLRVLAAHHSLRSTEHNGNLTSKRPWKQRGIYYESFSRLFEGCRNLRWELAYGWVRRFTVVQFRYFP